MWFFEDSQAKGSVIAGVKPKNPRNIIYKPGLHTRNIVHTYYITYIANISIYSVRASPLQSERKADTFLYEYQCLSLRR